MKKNMYLIEAVNVVYWYNQLGEDRLNELDFKIRWALKKAINKMLPDVKDFESMRDEEMKTLQAKWFDEEHSEEYMESVKDENGNEVKDEDGNVQTQQMRKVKDEYVEDYQKDINALNSKLNEILAEKNTYEYNSADVDTFVSNIGDPKYLKFEDCEMLDAILTDNGEDE